MKKKRIPARVGGGHPENPLQRARVRAGVSQEKAAEELSCDPRTVQRYESGEKSPNKTVLEKMTSCYSCPLSALFEKEDTR